MKPNDGDAWVGVTGINNSEELKAAYDISGTRVMNVQKGVLPNDAFIRCIGLRPQFRFVNYDPDAPLHDRYRMDHDFLPADQAQQLADMTLVINAFFGWDFNSCEALRQNDIWHPIDFANACPDSQVTSLHYHFPWLIKANLRWSIFCAATNRSMKTDLDWHEYFAIADQDISFEEKLAAYVVLARKHFDIDTFRADARWIRLYCAEGRGEKAARLHMGFHQVFLSMPAGKGPVARFPGRSQRPFRHYGIRRPDHRDDASGNI